MSNRDEFDEEPIEQLGYEGVGAPDFDDEDVPPDPPRLEANGLVFSSVDEFVTEYLLAMYRRALSGTETTWCPEWWRHSEAVIRLDALWRTWEHLRVDPTTGISTWFAQHCDYHMRILLSASGPFKGCTSEQHSGRPLKPLPSTPMPDELAAWLQKASDGELPRRVR